MVSVRSPLELVAVTGKRIIAVNRQSISAPIWESIDVAPPHAHTRLTAAWRGRVDFTDGLVVGEESGAVLAVDLQTGRVRARVPLGRREVAGVLDGVGVLLRDGNAAVVLDATNGEPRFRLGLPPSIDNASLRSARWLGNATRIFMLAENTLRAFDSKTGRLQWERVSDPRGQCTLPHWEMSVNRVVVWCESITAFNADDGAVVSQRPVPANVEGGAPGALRDDRMIFIAKDALVASNVDTGKEYWRTPLRTVDVAVSHGADGAVFACTEGGVLHAFDLRDGLSRWSWGLGSCSNYPGRHSFLLVPDAPGGTGVVGERTPAGVVSLFEVFLRDASPLRPLHTIASGVLRVDEPRTSAARVWINDVPVTVGTDGYFSAAIDVPGTVRLEIAETVGAKCLTGVAFAENDGIDMRGLDLDARTVEGPCDK